MVTVSFAGSPIRTTLAGELRLNRTPGAILRAAGSKRELLPSRLTNHTADPTGINKRSANTNLSTVLTPGFYYAHNSISGTHTELSGDAHHGFRGRISGTHTEIGGTYTWIHTLALLRLGKIRVCVPDSLGCASPFFPFFAGQLCTVELILVGFKRKAPRRRSTQNGSHACFGVAVADPLLPDLRIEGVRCGASTCSGSSARGI